MLFVAFVFDFVIAWVGFVVYFGAGLFGEFCALCVYFVDETYVV